MAQTAWRLHDAKDQFSKLVEAALNGEPQHVNRRGREAVVVLAATEYERLRRCATASTPGFVEHLLAMPHDEVGIAPMDLALRDIDF